MAATVVLEPCHDAINDGPEGSVIASLRSVTKKFGRQIALDRLSLQLRRGEVVALLGPNGAGKTTAVRLLLGLSQATSGEVRIFGNNPRDRASRMRLGAMLQVGRMPETLRVREHLDAQRRSKLRSFPPYLGLPAWSRRGMQWWCARARPRPCFASCSSRMLPWAVWKCGPRLLKMPSLRSPTQPTQPRNRRRPWP
jgi:energy-coupling factor transporter ATP-binding protein EcfA2